MYPLSFLSFPISGFILFPKAANSNKRIWGVLIIWVSILSYIPSTSSGSWEKALQVIWMCLQFVSAWSGWNLITKDKNYLTASGLLWVGHSHWFSCLLHHKSQILQGKIGLVRHINGLAPDTKELTEPIFHLGINRGSHINKMDTQGLKLISQSPPSLEMACTV